MDLCFHSVDHQSFSGHSVHFVIFGEFTYVIPDLLKNVYFFNNFHLLKDKVTERDI